MKAKFTATQRLIEVLPSIRVRSGFSKVPTSITFSWIIFSLRITFK